MTDAERRLWSALRGRRLQNYKFRRQHPLGPFIADFACIEYRLIVEADGGQHADNDGDRRRTAWLERHGWRVVRFWNNEILGNSEGVQMAVLQVLEGRDTQRSPHLPASRAPSSPVNTGEGGAQPARAGRVRVRATMESE